MSPSTALARAPAGAAAAVLDRRATRRLLRRARLRRRPCDQSRSVCSTRLHERSVGALLRRRGGEAPLGLRVIDERGRLVFGDPTAAGGSRRRCRSGCSSIRVDRIDSRLSGRVRPQRGAIEVSAEPASAVAGISRGYWPTVLSVLLMLVALGLTVHANRRAADLTRMQADFISHVSHQLKTPLSLLSAATETVTMDRAKSPEKLAQYLGIIRGEVARLSALVQRILEYSRLQQQRGYEFERSTSCALVRETVSAFESSLSGRQFAFRVEAPRARPASGRSRRHRTGARQPARQRGQVLGCEPGGHRPRALESGIGRRSKSSTAASASRKADQRRIFERFYRGSGRVGASRRLRPRPADRAGAGPRARRPRRSGERRRARAARSASCSRSRRDAPATASRRSCASTRAGEEIVVMKRALPEAAGPSREVLVVEDEPQMRALLTDNLEFEGYHVTAVDSAEAGAGRADAPHRLAACWST